jgi:hypothetical protein
MRLFVPKMPYRLTRSKIELSTSLFTAFCREIASIKVTHASCKPDAFDYSADNNLARSENC